MNRLKWRCKLTVRTSKQRNSDDYADSSWETSNKGTGVKATKSDGHEEAAGGRFAGPWGVFQGEVGLVSSARVFRDRNHGVEGEWQIASSSSVRQMWTLGTFWVDCAVCGRPTCQWSFCLNRKSESVIETMSLHFFSILHFKNNSWLIYFPVIKFNILTKRLKNSVFYFRSQI